MDQDFDLQSTIASLATGELRADEAKAWRQFEAVWGVLERFVRVCLITGGLGQNLLEDCGQEVFTRVWRFRTSYRGSTESEFWSWIRRICDNERRRILRREAARSMNPLPLRDPEGPHNARLTGPDETVSRSSLNEELAGLQHCLTNLDAQRRRVLKLAYFDPVLSERAIAEVIGCSPSNVHKLKSEGLRLLKACLMRRGIQ